MSLADIVREVAESRSVTEGAAAAFKGLHAKIAELSQSALNEEGLKAELARLAAELNAQQELLTAAMVTGTVADPSTPPPDNGVANAPNVEPQPDPAPAIVDAAVAVENAQPTG